MKAYVAPSEHRTEYGFEIIRDGKIIHSGYATPCNAIELFAITPSAQAALQAEGAKQEREWVLKSIEDWVGGASQELDYGYYDPTVYVFELEAKIKYLRQNQSTGDGGK
jgi:hypothetical protein